MNSVQSRLVMCAVAFAVTLLSGILLSSAGRPYSTGIFTIHKLVAVGTIILVGVSIFHLQKTADAPTLQPMLYAITALLFVALIGSGAVLSLVDGDIITLQDGMFQAMRLMHQIVPLLAVSAAAMSLYVLVSSRA